MMKLIFIFLFSSTALGQGIIPPTSDSDGHPFFRTKFAPIGWTYQYHSIEFETCKLSSIYNKDQNGNDLQFATLKFYNASDVELTTQESIDSGCVKTVLDWEPTWNYEIIGGGVSTQSTLSNDLRVWLIAAPDISEENGGSKVFINGLNFLFFKEKTFHRIDGRTSKELNYHATYHTNKLRVVSRGAVGEKNKILAVFELNKN